MAMAAAATVAESSVGCWLSAAAATATVAVVTVAESSAGCWLSAAAVTLAAAAARATPAAGWVMVEAGLVAASAAARGMAALLVEWGVREAAESACSHRLRRHLRRRGSCAHSRTWRRCL